ncbi:hypothetical protein ACFQY4_11420 [Catellatospora bangladeshensis]|uniref:DUF7662 domain-containing protein n=1 Tax=Catellatospora bangladeshensis TaxID=310355 RepID=A0A8J3JCL4_9ACTN|nr:hypothetical protein [Catellatospora bangladeshensis]GIF81861.1 hypothetical protein Cba03nite_32100 [Catellatospora bangladeshensis]
MSKYEPLRWFLAGRPEDTREVRMSFAEIEGLVGSLPRSAREYRPWWANSALVQAQSWLAAGWSIDSVNLTAENVVFVRSRVRRRDTGSPVTVRPVEAQVGDVSRHEERSVRTTPHGPSAPVDHDGHDHTEAAVQAHVVTHLARDGWLIRRVTDTESREQGFDVLAEKAGRTLVVEAKGYPSRSYTDPRRAGETKPTSQATQARHWYSGALLKAVLTRDEHPAYEIAIALPDMPTYRSLHRRTAASLSLLQVGVLFVAPDGTVSVA